MNRHFASALTFATAIAAVACAVAIASSNAYAQGEILQATPFVSTRSRADVKAELMGATGVSAASSSDWAMQHNVPQRTSGTTSQEARARYMAAREEVRAMTSEDSGSSYLVRQRTRDSGGTMTAGTAR